MLTQPTTRNRDIFLYTKQWLNSTSSDKHLVLRTPY